MHMVDTWNNLHNENNRTSKVEYLRNDEYWNKCMQIHFTLEIRYSFENKHKKLVIPSKKEKICLYIPTTHPPVKKSLLPYHVFL